jgi:FkbM family methyltransferase
MNILRNLFLKKKTVNASADHHFSFRPGTLDKKVFDIVVNHNEYRVPSVLYPADIVIDIGAHIGSFSYAVLKRGARKVYAFEADPENYECLIRNLKPFRRYVKAFAQAVWRSDRKNEQLFHSGPSMMGNEVNTAGGNVMAAEGTPMVVVSFDDVIDSVTEGGQKRIKLVKLDCEWSEFPILLTSRKLDLIDNICGEFHEIGGKYNNATVPDRFRIQGFEEFTIEVLAQVLERSGFRITTDRAEGNHIGLFFASRLGGLW